MNHRTTAAAAAALLAGLPGLTLAVPYSLTSTTTTYTQDFNTLSSSNSLWTSGTTLTGWYAGTSSLTGGNAGTGTVSNATFYSFGALNATDRALGSISGTLTGGGLTTKYIYFGVTNNTASALSAFTLSWDSEVWRNAGSAQADSHTVSYRVGGAAPATSPSGFTNAGAAFNATAPISVGPAAPTNGNLSAWRQSGLGGTVNLATPWATGTTLWLAWTDAGTVHNGMAIDNMSLGVTAVSAVPEPQTYALMLAGLAGVGGLAWRRVRVG